MGTHDLPAGPPNAMCDSVYAFMDGELPEPQADHFRHHLARCERCAQKLTDGWILDERRRTLRQERAPAIQPQRAWSRWVPVATLFAGAAAAVMVVLSIQHTPALQATTPGPIAAVAPRRVKARVSGSGAAPYTALKQGEVFLGARRPEAEAVVMSAAELRELADRIGALEAQGDFLGAANTYVQWGHAEQATQYLPRIAPSPDRDVLESAVALGLGKPEPERALEAADRALRQRPQLLPALWNRALALGQLELPAAARHAMETVALAGESGWSGEATQDARAWQTRLQERHERYLAADRACRQMIETSAPVPEELARSAPGLARACLYRAARAALSEDQARRLLPLARQLDALDGGEWLRKYVESVASKSFARRRPLAEQYRRLTLREPLSTADVETFLQALRRSDERDILLGALDDAPLPLLNSTTAEYRAALGEAAKGGDPWWIQLNQEQLAVGERTEGHADQALGRLLSAAGDCGPHKPVQAMDARCAGLRRQLARSYKVMNRTAESREQALRSQALASLGSDWGLEIRNLIDLGQSDRQGGHTALALAYFDEAQQREPAGCRAPALLAQTPLDWGLVYTSLAQTHLRVLDFAAARMDLEEGRHCGGEPRLTNFFARADLARKYPPAPDEVSEFESGIEALSATSAAGGKVMAMHIRGRFQLEVDPKLGGTLLRKAISDADKLPEDENARRARAYSYTSLILAAGKSQRFDEAFELFAEERGIPAPRSCALAVAADDERTLVLVRGSTGATRGLYDAGRTQPLESAEGLVPEPLREELAGCPSVRMIARPPLVGMEKLLPDDLAWSYLGRRAAFEPASGGGEESTLLVTRPLPPAELGLDDIGALPLPASTGAAKVVELKNGDATPARALDAMEQASWIYLHAHGVLKDSSDPAYLALSPDPDGGKYVLTDGDIRKRKLARRPVVVLIACDAAHSGPFLHQVFDLPSAFLEAGARMVFAARAPIPNEQASEFFDDLMKRVRGGGDPAVALRDAKRAWAQKATNGWVQHVLLFQASGD